MELAIRRPGTELARQENAVPQSKTVPLSLFLSRNSFAGAGLDRTQTSPPEADSGLRRTGRSAYFLTSMVPEGGAYVK